MKKVLFFVIAAVIFGFLAGCNYKYIDELTFDSEVDLRELLKDPRINIDFPLLTITKYNEYKYFLKKVDGKRDIVKYHTIKEIGKFTQFVVTSGGYNGNYSTYIYTLRDKSGFEIGFSVADTSKTKSPISPVDLNRESAKENLRYIDNSSSGRLVLDGYEYRYLNGSLLSIVWYEGNMLYTISGNPSLSDYPEGSDTFMSKTLNRETSSTCLDSLKEKINNNR